jgi:hypothetical protein
MGFAALLAAKLGSSPILERDQPIEGVATAI